MSSYSARRDAARLMPRAQRGVPRRVTHPLLLDKRPLKMCRHAALKYHYGEDWP